MRKKPGWRAVSLASLGMILTAAPPLIALVDVPPLLAQAVPAEVRQGYTLLGQGRVGEAIATFQQAVRRYPQSTEAKLGLAIAYRRNGQDAEAFQAYQLVLNQDPNNVLALRSVGLLGGFRPEWQTRGIEALNRLLSLNSNDLDARTQRALLLGYQGRFPESIADYEIVLRSRSTPDVVLGAAQVYSYNGDYARSLDLFGRYQQQTNKAITGYAAIAYARALRNTGNAAAAVRILEPKLTNKTDDLTTQLRVELSQAYLANGQQTQALAVLDPLRGRSDAILPLARAFNEIGQRSGQAPLLAEAANLYKQALNRTPNPSPQLLREVADVLSGQPQEKGFALQLYRQLVALQPNDRGLQLKRLSLEADLGFISEGDLRQSLRALLQTPVTDPADQRAIAQGLVRIEGDPELLPIYQSLIQSGVATNEPFLYFRTAQALIKRNDLPGARAALANYTATPDAAGDLAPQLLAAEIERREGNLQGAATRYEAVIAANPADQGILFGAYQGLAGIRLSQGRTGEALVIYDQLVARNPQDLKLQLGRTSLAYQAGVISEAQAVAVLNTWLSSRPPTDTPAELYSLVGNLPANPRLEPLYFALAQANPDYIPVQVRLVQVTAQRSIPEARVRVAQLVARSRSVSAPTDPTPYLLQAQLAQAVGDTTIADQSYRVVLAQQPDNVDALVGLGGIQFQQRRFEAAETSYAQAIALRPNDVGIRRSFVELTVAQDRPLAAIQQLEQLQTQQFGADPGLRQRQQQIEEGFLNRRGFQPPWERY